MPKVVIDTSVWLSGIFWRGIPHRVLQAWRAGDFEVVVSEALLAELEQALAEKVAEFETDPGIVEEWMTLIDEEAFLVEPGEQIQACRDADDDKFLEAAIAGQAAFIVSGDKDLTDMVRFRDVEIVAPRQFLKHLLRTL
jgi:putative PIN family toxin of toxin-antitoxin system